MNLKTNFVVSGVIKVISYVYIFIGCIMHFVSDNIWVEQEDKDSTIFVYVIMLFLVVAIISFVVALNKKPSQKKEPDYCAIKTRSVSNICIGIFGILFLCIFSQELVASIIGRLFSVSPTQADYIAGYYGVAKNAFFVINIVDIISNFVALYITADCSQEEKSKESNSQKDNVARTKEENEKIRQEIEEIKSLLENKISNSNSKNK